MVGWVLFVIVAFLVFGVPLIDELYRRRARRAANLARQVLHEPVSLVPDQNARNLPISRGSPAELERTADQTHQAAI
jgi:hypothetical protein